MRFGLGLGLGSRLGVVEIGMGLALGSAHNWGWVRVRVRKLRLRSGHPKRRACPGGFRNARSSRGHAILSVQVTREGQEKGRGGGGDTQFHHCSLSVGW